MKEYFVCTFSTFWRIRRKTSLACFVQNVGGIVGVFLSVAVHTTWNPTVSPRYARSGAIAVWAIGTLTWGVVFEITKWVTGQIPTRWITNLGPVGVRPSVENVRRPHVIVYLRLASLIVFKFFDISRISIFGAIKLNTSNVINWIVF